MPYMPPDMKPYSPCLGLSQFRNPSSKKTIFLPVGSALPQVATVSAGSATAATTPRAASASRNATAALVASASSSRVSPGQAAQRSMAAATAAWSTHAKAGRFHGSSVRTAAVRLHATFAGSPVSGSGGGGGGTARSSNSRGSSATTTR